MQTETLCLDYDSPEAAMHNTANDMLMAKTLSEKLMAAYPNHAWAVNVEHRTGLISIRDMYLSGQWGYVLKLKNIYSSSSLERDAVRGAGEMLERFRLSRGKFNVDEYADAPIDFAGRLLFDKG